MKRWYVCQTWPGREQETADLIERTVRHDLWQQCRILKKETLFRVGGKLILNSDVMFPGYVFVESEYPDELLAHLRKSREYPELIGADEKSGEFIPVEKKDLEFLQHVCGENLEKKMELSEVEADGEGNLTQVSGILKDYENRIVRKRLRKRYVLAEVDLFQRKEPVLFGIVLPGDQILADYPSSYDIKTQRQSSERQ